MSQADRPYSANPNAVPRSNPYMSEVVQADNFVNKDVKTTEKKRRPKTGKTRSVQVEEAKHMISEYASPGKDSSGKSMKMVVKLI